MVPPQGATVNVWATDPLTGRDVLSRQHVLSRADVRAYRGVTVHPAHTSKRMYEDELGVSRARSGISEQGVMGAASIMLLDDGSVSGQPRFEGTFEWKGNPHTIQSSKRYDSLRGRQDPAPHKRALRENHLIIHRASDIMTQAEADKFGLGISRRDEEGFSSSCSSDRHEYNANNPLILSGVNDFDTSFSPMDFFVPEEAAPLSSRYAARGLASWWSSSASNEVDIAGLAEPLDLRSFTYETNSELTRRQSTGGDAMGNSGNASYTGSIGSTQGCPTEAQVVYVGMAADCTFTAANEGDTAATATNLLGIMNSVSTIYRNTFNVSLGVVELDVRESSCSTTGDATWNRECSALAMDERLNAFSAWRGQQPGNGTGIWELFTTCNTGSEVGVAWLGTLCVTTSSSSSGGGDSVSGTALIADSSRNVQVTAHETGHVMGAIHDCATGCRLSGSRAQQNGGATCCPSSSSGCDDDGDHIMSPVASQATSTFSACSIGNICSMLGGGLNTSCVEDPGQRETLSTQQCGNGILETTAGEECDAGPNGSACCTSDCRLVEGAVCDPSSSSCCQSTCQFAPSTQLCRPAKDDSDCDLAEYCTGSSDTCPTDTFKDNGESCGSGSLACANGRCTSRDAQCAALDASSTLTQACPSSTDTGCSVSCRDSSNSRSCTVFNNNWVDGTPCGYGGYCQQGQCQTDSSNWQRTFRNWYRDNLQISIPVTIVVGIIVLLLLWCLIKCCFCGGRKGPKRSRFKRGAAVPQPPPPMMQQPYYNAPPAAAPPPSHPSRMSGQTNSYSSSGGPPPVPPRAAHTSGYPSYNSPNSQRGSGGWVDPTQWNGPPSGRQQ